MAIQQTTNRAREDITEVVCPSCGKEMQRDKLVYLQCSICGNTMDQRKSTLARKRVLRCSDENCLGPLEIVDEKDFFFCENCKISNISKIDINEGKNVKYTSYALETDSFTEDIHETLSDELKGGLDLVLVAPRHLFRMPYSLHEKTSLVSVVLKKEEIDTFLPRDANPLKLRILDFMPKNERDEAKDLLMAALNWKKLKDAESDKIDDKKYKPIKNFEKIDVANVTEQMFPDSIKKLLKGLNDGKKRGLFVLLTFLRTVNYSPEQIINRIKEWNKLNTPPLREGYIKSQIDWHLKQKKLILPPNYDNESFYRDIGIITKKPDAKNPIVELLRRIRKNESNNNASNSTK
jgi:hypothetical protein